jgi:hypothetical protein
VALLSRFILRFQCPQSLYVSSVLIECFCVSVDPIESFCDSSDLNHSVVSVS